MGVDSAALQHTAAALRLYEPRNRASEHIRSTGLHSITAPWVDGAAPCTHEDYKECGFCFTLGSLPDDLIGSENDIRGT